MDRFPNKQSAPTENHDRIKIVKTEGVFEFPIEPTKYSDEMTVVKHFYGNFLKLFVFYKLSRCLTLRLSSTELQERFIPFKTAGIGKMFVTNELLRLLYEKSESDPHGKLECGISIFPVRDYDAKLDGAMTSQEYWKNQIGSFLSALEKTGVTIRHVVSPYWYKQINWLSLHTIATQSSIEHDIYFTASHDVEYEWH